MLELFAVASITMLAVISPGADFGFIADLRGTPL